MHRFRQTQNRVQAGGRRKGWLLVGVFLLSAVAWGTNATFTFVRKGLTTKGVLFSSPTLVDLDGNPLTLEIVVGDEGGNIYGFDSTAALMWTFSIRSFAGFETVQTPCQCSPAVADLDGDGRKEVVVSLAKRDSYNEPQYPGCIFMFRLDPTGRNPTATNGFARRTLCRNGDGVPDGVFASPTLSDLDGDGQLEILAGAWDELLYALRPNGSLAWNLNNDLTDDQEYGFKTGDTIWTTPAVADIDSDGVNEVVFGSDAHSLPDGSPFWGHQIPYQMRNGGLLVVLHAPTGLLDWGAAGAGKFFIESYRPEGSGWYYNEFGENHIPRDNISEVLQSSPVIGDVDDDGKMEIIHGTGQTSFAPTDNLHNRIFCFNGDNATTCWVYDAGAEVYATPALVNVDNDPDVEVFVRQADPTSPKICGVKGSTGAAIAGYPVAITAGNYRSIGPVVGDVDGDGTQEIILVAYGMLHVFGADGVDESHFYDAPSLMFTSPAIGDIDSDGKCEMLVTTSEGIYLYRCNNGTAGVIPWGQYRRDARKSGVLPLFDSARGPITLLGDLVGGETAQLRVQFQNIGSAVWTSQTVELVNSSVGWSPATISLPPANRTPNAKVLDMTVTLKVPRQLGFHTLIFQLRQQNGDPFGVVLAQLFVVNQLAAPAQHWRLYR